MTYIAYPSVTIIHNETDVTSKVISYTRGKDLCNFTGECAVVFDSGCGLSFSMWDRILIRDLSSTGVDGYYFVNTVVKDAKHITVSCQDGSKRLQDYFIDTPYTSYLGQTTKTLIEYFLDLAGVTYSFDASVGNGELVQPYTSYGMTSAMTTIASLLQQSSWYAYFDGNNVMQIFELTQDETNSVGTIPGNEILSMKIITSDKMFRNRVVVWGGGDPDTGDYVYADVGITSEHQIDEDDIRTVVVQNGNIDSSADAVEIATDVLNVLSKINDEVIVECTFRSDDTDLRGVDLAKVFTVASTKLNYTGIVTEIEVDYGIGGLVITLNLGKKCPKIFGYYNYPGTATSGEQYNMGWIRGDVNYKLYGKGVISVPNDDWYYSPEEGNLTTILPEGIGIAGINSNPVIHTMLDDKDAHADYLLSNGYYYKNYYYYATIDNYTQANEKFMVCRYDTVNKTEVRMQIGDDASGDSVWCYAMYGKWIPLPVGFFISDDDTVYFWSYQYYEELLLQVHLLDFENSTVDLVETKGNVAYDFANTSQYFIRPIRLSDNTVMFFGLDYYDTETKILTCTFDMSTIGNQNLPGTFGNVQVLTEVHSDNEYATHEAILVNNKIVFSDIEDVDATHSDMTIYAYDTVEHTLHLDTFSLPTSATPYTLVIDQTGIIPSYSNNCVYIRVMTLNYQASPYVLEISSDNLYRFSLETYNVLDHRSLNSEQVLQHFYNDENVYELHRNGNLYDIINGTLITTITDPLFVNNLAQADFCVRMDDSNNFYFCAPSSNLNYGLVYKYTLSTNSIELLADLEMDFTKENSWGALTSEQLLFLPSNKLLYLASAGQLRDATSPNTMTYILENS